MIHINKNTIRDTIEYAHAEANAYCENYSPRPVSCDIAEELDFMYSTTFIETLLVNITDNRLQTTDTGWTLTELAVKLTLLGFKVVTYIENNTKTLEVSFGIPYIILEEDQKGKTLIWDDNEFEMGIWDQSIVDFLLIIKNELPPEGIYSRIEEFVKLHTVRKKEYEIKIATAISIIRTKFKDMKHAILNERLLHNDLFICDIETDWGMINIGCYLTELSDTLDNIIQQKQDFDQLTVGLCDESC